MSTQSTASGNIFAIPADRKSARVLLTAVPWEVTTSYGSGTSLGPEAILKASPQVDLFDLDLGEAWRAGFFLEDTDPWFAENNARLKSLAQKVIEEWDEKGEIGEAARAHVDHVNAGSAEMVKRVYEKTLNALKAGRIPGLIGGDHSTPLGAIQAVSESVNGDLGVLHIDAHADLRDAYHGFKHSHASIMRNVCGLSTPPKRLVQVGIRDFCFEEYDFIQKSEGRIKTFFDRKLKERMFAGESWKALCDDIVSQLPKRVYVSFDIDGLSPEFCPGTGTPVPGGLSFDQATYLLKILGQSGRTILGFDLNEVAPSSPDSEWDGNVGARMLFLMCSWAVRTNGYQS